MNERSSPRGQEQRGGGGRSLAGAGAGVLAALAMMAFMIVAGALEGDALDPLGSVGTAFRGADADLTGPTAVAWGALVHLAVGAALGVVFAAIVPRDMPVTCSTAIGAGAALFWMAFAIKALIPWLAPVLHAEMPRHGGAWVIAHVVFGGVVGLAPWLARRMGEPSPRRLSAKPPGALRPRTSE